jgi:hypothetical protein
MSYWLRYDSPDGWTWAVLNVGDPSLAPRIGPPDLSLTGLSEEDRRRVCNRLVNLGIIDGVTIMNRRHEIRTMLKQLGLDVSLERTITGLYQQAYIVSKE